DRSRDGRRAGKLSPGIHARGPDQCGPHTARPGAARVARSRAPPASRAGGAAMNWTSSLLAGFAGTLVLTTLEAGAQQAHLTRMSIPYLLGTMLTPSRDRAKILGFLVHLVNGQLFALFYVAIFDRLGGAGPWRGAVV